MGFQKFLRDKEALKGLFQICVFILIFAILIILIILIFYPSENGKNIIPLLTFILGEILGGVGVYLWGRKK